MKSRRIGIPAAQLPSAGNNAFLGKTVQPIEREVAAVLGPAAPAWNELLDWLLEKQNLAGREWNFTSQGTDGRSG